jgi:hypothetical protein
VVGIANTGSLVCYATQTEVYYKVLDTLLPTPVLSGNKLVHAGLGYKFGSIEMARSNNMLYITTNDSLNPLSPINTFYSVTLQLPRMNLSGNTIIPAFNFVLYSNSLTSYYPYRVGIIRGLNIISLSSPYYETYLIFTSGTSVTINLPTITNLMVGIKLRFIMQSAVSTIVWNSLTSGLVMLTNTTATPVFSVTISITAPPPYTFMALPNLKSNVTSPKPYIWQQI